jgi:hypothetical protein
LIKGRSWNFHEYEYLVQINYDLAPSLKDNHIIYKKDGTCAQHSHPIMLLNELIYLYDFTGTWELIENDTPGYI